jgi:hypothetical protein
MLNNRMVSKRVPINSNKNISTGRVRIRSNNLFIFIFILLNLLSGYGPLTNNQRCPAGVVATPWPQILRLLLIADSVIRALWSRHRPHEVVPSMVGQG